MSLEPGLIAAGLGLGLTAALQPCMLALHLSTATVVSGAAPDRRRIARLGLALTLGFALTHLLLALAFAAGCQALPAVAAWLQQTFVRLLGPLLILAGVGLSGLLGGGSARWEAWLARCSRATHWGFGGAVVIGLLLALCFCPASAALFFGVLLPLAVTQAQPVPLALAYSVGLMTPLLIVTQAGRLWAPATVPGAPDRRWLAVLPKAIGVTAILFGLLHTLRHVYGL